MYNENIVQLFYAELFSLIVWIEKGLFKFKEIKKTSYKIRGFKYNFILFTTTVVRQQPNFYLHRYQYTFQNF